MKSFNKNRYTISNSSKRGFNTILKNAYADSSDGELVYNKSA